MNGISTLPKELQSMLLPEIQKLKNTPNRNFSANSAKQILEDFKRTSPQIYYLAKGYLAEKGIDIESDQALAGVAEAMNKI